MAGDHADPGLARDVDRLLQPLQSVDRPVVDHARKLPERHDCLAALVRNVEPVVRRHDRRERNDFLGLAEAGGTVFDARAESPGPRLHPLPHQLLHPRDLPLGGGAFVVAAHNGVADRAVADHRDEVHRVALGLEGRNLRGYRPVQVAAVGAADHGGAPLAVQAFRPPRLDVVGGHGPVGVRVQVDEAGADVHAGGVDVSPGGCAGHAADADDLVAVDGDVGPEPVVAGAVDDASVADDDVVVLGGGGGGGDEQGGGEQGEGREHPSRQGRPRGPGRHRGVPIAGPVPGHCVHLSLIILPVMARPGIAPSTFSLSRTTNWPPTRTWTTPTE